VALIPVETPGKNTVVPPLTKFSPSMETTVGAAPLCGKNALMTGATRKLEAVETPVPPAKSSNGPLVAPTGTTTSNWLSEMFVKSAKVGISLLKTTVVTPLKPDPLMAMTLPGWPDTGEKPLIVTVQPDAGRINSSMLAAALREIKKLLVLKN